MMKKAPSSETISTREMRLRFHRVLRGVKQGRSLTLTYRNKPLATIVPVATETKVTTDDTIFKLKEIAEPMGPLTNSEIDAAIYGA